MTALAPRLLNRGLSLSRAVAPSAPLDEIDIAIIRTMGVQPYGVRPKDGACLSTRYVAKALGIAPETVRERLKAMEKIGVISGYGLIPNMQLFGLQMSQHFLYLKESQRPAQVAESLRHMEGLVGLYTFTTPVVVAIVAYRSAGDLTRKLRLLEGLAGGARVVKLNDVPVPVLNRPLSHLDWRIIQALSGNARKPLSKVAKELRVNPRTVKRRYGRMAAEGCFFPMPLIDPDPVPGIILFELHVELSPEAGPETLNQVHRALQSNYFALTTGSARTSSTTRWASTRRRSGTSRNCAARGRPCGESRACRAWSCRRAKSASSGWTRRLRRRCGGRPAGERPKAIRQAGAPLGPGVRAVSSLLPTAEQVGHLRRWADLSRTGEATEALRADPQGPVEVARRHLAYRNVAVRRNAVRALEGVYSEEAPLPPSHEAIAALASAFTDPRPLVMFEAMEAARRLRGLDANDPEEPYPPVPEKEEPLSSPAWRANSLALRAMHLKAAHYHSRPTWSSLNILPTALWEPPMVSAYWLERVGNRFGVPPTHDAPERPAPATRRQWAERVLQVYRSKGDESMWLGLGSLMFFEDPLTRGGVLRATSSPARNFRHSALVAAGLLGSPQVIEIAAQSVKARDGDVGACMTALGLLGDIRGLDIVAGAVREGFQVRPGLEALAMAGEGAWLALDLLVSKTALLKNEEALTLITFLYPGQEARAFLEMAASAPGEKGQERVLKRLAVDDSRKWDHDYKSRTLVERGYVQGADGVWRADEERIAALDPKQRLSSYSSELEWMKLENRRRTEAGPLIGPASPLDDWTFVVAGELIGRVQETGRPLEERRKDLWRLRTVAGTRADLWVDGALAPLAPTDAAALRAGDSSPAPAKRS